MSGIRKGREGTSRWFSPNLALPCQAIRSAQYTNKRVYITANKQGNQVEVTARLAAVNDRLVKFRVLSQLQPALSLCFPGIPVFAQSWIFVSVVKQPIVGGWCVLVALQAQHLAIDEPMDGC